MSEEKRKVSTDALETLGTIIGSGDRDAIHLAVEPCTAGETLYPGQHIGIVDGKASTKTNKKLGIVDPFIIGFVPEGKMFWLVVYPRQITSLRHVWSHPDFTGNDAIKKNDPDKTPVQIAEKWLREYAAGIDESYEYVMQVADSHQKTGGGHYQEDYIVQGGRFEGWGTPEEFWDNYAIVRGVDNPVRESFFSCSC